MIRVLNGRVFAVRLMSIVTLSFMALATSSSFASFEYSSRAPRTAFPQGPQAEMTPGSLCEHSGVFRYPEHIAYCNRNVDSGLKREIIREYDTTFGYSVGSMPRGEFKIDHYIPLCAGGSNNQDNLWPQHESVYAITDPLEPAICGKMAAGRLEQAEAVALIKEAKNDLSKVPAILAHVQAL